METGPLDGRSPRMRVRVNGKYRDLPEAANLHEYVVSLGVNMATIAVAVNGEVVKRDDLALVELSEGDTVEIVRAVGGG